MPIIEIKIVEGRDQGVKKQLIENVTKTVAETLDVPAERIRTLVYDIPATQWGIGGKTFEEVRLKR